MTKRKHEDIKQTSRNGYEVLKSTTVSLNYEGLKKLWNYSIQDPDVVVN